MSEEKKEEIKLTPAEESPWGKFLLDSVARDNSNDKGYYWFARLYHLHAELNKIPSFNLSKIKVSGSNNNIKLIETAVDNTSSGNISVIYAVADLLKDLGNPVTIDEIDLSNLIFKDDIDITSFIFPIKVSFRNTVFSKSVNLSRTEFHGTTDFNSTIFAGMDATSANFEQARFRELVTFANAATNHGANFLAAEFFNGAGFNNIKFAGTINFNNANFHYSGAEFNEAQFTGGAYFRGTTFSGGAIFNDAKFLGYTINFSDANFFSGTHFRNAEFSDYAFFNNAEFKYQTDFTNAKFNTRAPLFCGAKLYSDIHWDGVEWPDFPKDFKEHKGIIQDNKNAYEELANLMKKLDKYHDQHLFFREEMRCRRKLGGFFNSLLYGFYEVLADYGYGVGLALFWWFVHIILGAIAIFIIASGTGLGFEPAFFCSASTSFANANPFVFIGFKEGGLTDCYKVLHYLLPIEFGTIRGVQTFFGIPLLFILLATLRIRFRLK